MNKPTHTQQKSLPPASQWPALPVWAAGWLLMLLLDGTLALSSLAMLLVLTAAVAALWLRLAWSLLICLLAVTVFNWMFVPPRLTLAIDLQQDAMLLLVTLAVSVLVTGLMSSLRLRAQQLQHQTQVITSLHDFSDSLRDAMEVLSCLPRLRQLLQEATQADTTVLALRSDLPADDDLREAVLAGNADSGQLGGLWLCLRSGHPLGPGSDSCQGQRGLYLPLRGRSQHYGAALLQVEAPLAADVMAQAQALCDQMGAALERQHWQQQQLAAPAGPKTNAVI